MIDFKVMSEQEFKNFILENTDLFLKTMSNNKSLGKSSFGDFHQRNLEMISDRIKLGYTFTFIGKKNKITNQRVIQIFERYIRVFKRTMLIKLRSI